MSMPISSSCVRYRRYRHQNWLSIFQKSISTTELVFDMYDVSVKTALYGVNTILVVIFNFETKVTISGLSQNEFAKKVG